MTITEKEVEEARKSFDEAMCKYLDYLDLKEAALRGRPSIEGSFPEFHSVATPFRELINSLLQARDEEIMKMVDGIKVTGVYDEVLEIDGKRLQQIIDERLKPILITAITTEKEPAKPTEV